MVHMYSKPGNLKFQFLAWCMQDSLFREYKITEIRKRSLEFSYIVCFIVFGQTHMNL